MATAQEVRLLAWMPISASPMRPDGAALSAVVSAVVTTRGGSATVTPGVSRPASGVADEGSRCRVISGIAIPDAPGEPSTSDVLTELISLVSIADPPSPAGGWRYL